MPTFIGIAVNFDALGSTQAQAYMDLVKIYRDPNWLHIRILTKKVYQRLRRQWNDVNRLIQKLREESNGRTTRGELHSAMQAYAVTKDDVGKLFWLLKYFQDTVDAKDMCQLGNTPMIPLRVDEDNFNASVAIVKKYEILGGMQ